MNAEHSPETRIGGEPVARLLCEGPFDDSRPAFTEAVILPGRGMNLLQLRALVPELGEVDVIHSLPLDKAQQFLDEEDDASGTNAFRIGGAVLLPWANRIRGRVIDDGEKIEASILGKQRVLDANWSGDRPGAEPHAIHGLILRARFTNLRQSMVQNAVKLSGDLGPTNFGGHWFSELGVTVHYELTRAALLVKITCHNAGKENCPVGIGMHTYFTIPSGEREQARLRLPVSQRALVNNYDDVFPTGELESVAGSPYGFSSDAGEKLGSMYLDDMFTDVSFGPDGSAVAEIIDPLANYAVRMSTPSRAVKAFQVYGVPEKKNFVAVEPQFNWNDPFSPVWAGRDTGMKILKPGDSTTLEVKLEVFRPRP